MVQQVRGFTLVELLIVIAIIGVLSSTVLVALNDTRAKANNARRMADLKELQKALELYYSDHGSYPVQTGWRGTTPGCYGTGADPSTAIPGLVPTYISVLPQDPQPKLSSRCYLYTSDGVDYKLLAYDTVEGDPLPPGAPMARYPSECGASQRSYSIYTPGYRCR